jgi:hypothetical protein
MRPTLLSLLLGLGLAACGGATTSEPAPNDPGPGTTPGPGTGTPGTGTDPAGPVTTECPNAEPVIVKSGGEIARPSGSALRLSLVYQGSSIGVTQLRGIDKTLSPSDGPFEPGKVSGYWADLLGGNGARLYTQLFMDPTRLEAPASPGGSDWKNTTRDRCEAKTIALDVPNDPIATTLVVYGSPYGTFEGAIELARFTLK